ncbi:alpha/beta hydrolase [Nocardioides cavernaquae]|uniref:Alpha/beta fold hydrolase n=1 Tax=Nocardioides cavernaquae TaxID=2321396 RepID=A0A3A5H9X2_9ACTN|nr:alpha/beta fold hydrolase [Nocardioides cavernaquae]RJS44827.1 alpha/beta fold hydrolase [Nocardioides cavernaquae]
MDTLDPARPWSAIARPELTGGRTIGVLLSHGFTGSPFSMRPWAEFLNEHGYAVEMPRLPGHGTTWQDLNSTGWDDWYAELTAAFVRLQQSCEQVFVCGLSMGGGLALRLAADRPGDIAGLVLVNPAVNSTNKQLLALPVLKHVVKGLPGIGNDIKKKGVDEYGYPKVGLRALSSLLAGWKALRADLGKVKAPLLLFRSTVDHVVDPSSARIILGSVASADAREVPLTDSFHVATLDNDAPAIFEGSLAFLREHAAV